MVIQQLEHTTISTWLLNNDFRKPSSLRRVTWALNHNTLQPSFISIGQMMYKISRALPTTGSGWNR